VLELLLFFAISAACFGGCATLLFAHSLRDVHLQRIADGHNAAQSVDWRFGGVRFWQQRWRRIVSVEAKNKVLPVDDTLGGTPTPDVETQVCFRDETGRAVLTLRESSLHGRVTEMQTWLATAPANAAELSIRETSRWFSGQPIANGFWCGFGLLIGFAMGIFFLIGAISSLHIRPQREYAASFPGI